MDTQEEQGVVPQNILLEEEVAYIHQLQQFHSKLMGWAPEKWSRICLVGRGAEVVKLWESLEERLMVPDYLFCPASLLEHQQENQQPFYPGKLLEEPVFLQQKEHLLVVMAEEEEKLRAYVKEHQVPRVLSQKDLQKLLEEVPPVPWFAPLREAFQGDTPGEKQALLRKLGRYLLTSTEQYQHITLERHRERK